MAVYFTVLICNKAGYIVCHEYAIKVYAEANTTTHEDCKKGHELYKRYFGLWIMVQTYENPEVIGYSDSDWAHDQ